jgi:uncharacterized membrane protein
MFAPHPVRRCLVALSAALLAPLAAEAYTPPAYYDIAEIASLAPGGFVRPRAINDGGQATGSADTRPDNAYRAPVMAFLASGDTSIGMGHAIGGHQSKGLAINHDGTVVGTYLWTQATLWGGGFVWTRDGNVVRLAGTSSAVGINDAGTVAGNLNDAGTPYLWKDGVFTVVPAPFFANVTAINALGDLLVNTADSIATWHDGTWTDIGRFGGTRAKAYAFNSHGTVVGTVYQYDRLNKKSSIHAAISDNGVMSYFGIGWYCCAPRSEAYAVNEDGVVVGKAVLPGDTYQRAVVIYPDRAKAHKLADRLAPGTSGWFLLDATGINDAGQIVGNGRHDGRTVGYVLTPHE